MYNVAVPFLLMLVFFFILSQIGIIFLGFDMSIYQKNWSQILRFKDQDVEIGDSQQVNFHIDLGVVTFGGGNLSLPKYEAIKQGWLNEGSNG